MQEAAEDALSMFSQQLNTQYTANMTAKMGLQKYDKDIAVDLLTNMYEDKTGEQQQQQQLLPLLRQSRACLGHCIPDSTFTLMTSACVLCLGSISCRTACVPYAIH